MTNKEAIEWLERIEERYIHGGDEAFDEARKEALHTAIEALERKRGEWAEEGYCPFCKCDMPAFIEDWEWKRCRTPYCPNCGAKMRDSNG